MSRKSLNAEFSLSDEDIDHAWKRLYERIREELPSAGWTSSLRSAASLSGDVTTAAQAQESESRPHSPLPVRKRKLHLIQIRTLLLRKGMPFAAAATAASFLLFSPWGHNVMASVMNTFRVQQMQAVSISSADLQHLQQAIQQSLPGTRKLDLKQYGEIEQQGGGMSTAVSAKDVAATAGRTLKSLPGADLEHIQYDPQQTLIFKLHAKPINALIAFLGGQASIPQAVDGEPIKLTIPGIYTMTVPSGGTSLTQMPAPTLEVASGIDLDAIRQAILSLPVLPEDLRDQLAAIDDWRHTLPIPSISGTDSARVQTISVAGNNAALAQSNDRRTLVWQQDGWFYKLSGSLSDYPTERDIVAEAERLIRS
ncbi:hypothetical protein [Cohnella candidum]|uniref:DUF4367 domain-containing protein n=1 Tax=Cohnella candidum TaxID=2674991 RepID=A0A3G3JXY5_9BACL|nr:hypothetical protein [Cohnella candidum]AYQ72379.1 hypothetical protein EAV92_07205 [Cohnella candidum]